MTDWGDPVRTGKAGVNATSNPCLKKGHHREPPEIADAPMAWLLFLAFTRFLPRWQAARR